LPAGRLATDDHSFRAGSLSDRLAALNEPVLVTDRMVLRGWSDSDREPFAMMNADPTVMRFFPSVLSRAESDTLIDRFESERVDSGFCPWAAVLRRSSELIGFVGLHAPPDYIPHAPAVEVGWRLAERFWGHGYATEAAAAAIEFGFEVIGLDEIVSMTSVSNVRSRRVMERLGMERDECEDFDHPAIAEGDELRRHVLYRLDKSRYLGSRATPRLPTNP
jgi:RimJ/RimL family protein N-acetyltransferase